MTIDSKNNKKNITIEVSLDKNNIPQTIQWNATDGEAQNQRCQALMLALWDNKNKDTLRLDLWTKDMTIDEMKIFFYQTLSTMFESFEKATKEKKIMIEVKKFCNYFAKEMNIKV